MKRIHDFHRLDILNLILARNRNTARRQQTGSENDGTDGILVLRISRALVVVSQRPQLVVCNKGIQRDRSASGAFEFLGRTVGLDIEGGHEISTSLLCLL